ncbi:MAG: hypothetical protein ACRDYX_04325 [Egibacteraceae bacterium]
MSRSCPLKLAVGTVLLLSAVVLSAVVLLARPALAHTSAGPPDAADTQPANETARVASDERDRRVFATLAFTVIGTIGLITIGSVVLLTQPGDRQVMVVTDPADPPEPSAAPTSTRGATPDGKKPQAERRVPQ